MCEQCECSWLATYSCYALTVPEKDHYWHTADWRVFMPGGGVCTCECTCICGELGSTCLFDYMFVCKIMAVQLLSFHLLPND